MDPVLDFDGPDRRQQIADLVAQRAAGHGLPGEFYRSAMVYQAELDRIWRRGWLFVGHTCELPEPGTYQTFRLDTDSLVVVRGDDGEIRAFWNICRHRGTELCDQPAGKVGRLVCPYHQWTYARDGRLVSCWGMQDEIDKDALGLLPVQVRTLGGFIFVSLADDPPDFDALTEAVGPLAQPQGIDRAKVAKTVDYRVAANWKLVWENNRECYHCNANHPQYIKANFDHYNTDDTSAAVQRKIQESVAQSEQKWAAAGLAVSHRQTGMASFPDAERNGWFAANRTALAKGYVSESMDGRQVAPLMGDYTDADVGTFRFRTMPNMWHHASCDHGVTTRLLPDGLNSTRIRVTWLVDHEAVEGTDYHLEALMPFWQLTSEQDWALCERAQRGVTSSHYQPGPLSTHKEYNVDAFLRWCLHQLVES